jgi:alpha-glucosidase (family GH31 glycosyl hydrolase)
MFFAFTDADCFTAENQFMFGPQWLVAPVLVENATSVDVYLPAVTPQAVERLRESQRALGEAVRETEQRAAVWQHFYSGKQYAGGQWVTVATELSDFPLFQLVETDIYAQDAADSVGAVRE